MIIGLDIDNVITDFDDTILKEFLIEDKHKRGSGIVNKNASHINKGMFDWSKEEVEKFYIDNMERISLTLKPRRNCKKIIDKLILNGNKIILISHRAYPHYNFPMDVTKKWLKENNINYHKLVLSESPNKTKECKTNFVDVMVDDIPSRCRGMISNGINCIVMKTRYNSCESRGMLVAKSWNHLYELLSSLS